MAAIGRAIVPVPVKAARSAAEVEITASSASPVRLLNVRPDVPPKSRLPSNAGTSVATRDARGIDARMFVWSGRVSEIDARRVTVIGVDEGVADVYSYPAEPSTWPFRLK